ncbi:271_t:CDS:10 [Ambispora gerdemannii]|uniref:271_t:CDS:1 n=1 Tax=Ambispora gerdemannii TaxID=144530 RepID=A0A9N8YXF9_9GLOM|nr:271_t:CDS:10 [Ambispora gerdemannii]
MKKKIQTFLGNNIRSRNEIPLQSTQHIKYLLWPHNLFLQHQHNTRPNFALARLYKRRAEGTLRFCDIHSCGTGIIVIQICYAGSEFIGSHYVNAITSFPGGRVHDSNGAINDIAPEATTFSHRDAKFEVVAILQWKDKESDERIIGEGNAWFNDIFKPYSVGGPFPNTLGRGEEEASSQIQIVDLRELEVETRSFFGVIKEETSPFTNNLNESKGILRELLEKDIIIEDIQPIEKGTNLSQATPQHQIQFGVFKNFAEILYLEFQKDRKKRTAENAILYCKKAIIFIIRFLVSPRSTIWIALNIDATDRQSAYKLAVLYGSEVIDNRILALKFSNLGLYGPSPIMTPPRTSFSPLQWSCLEELARLHWDIGTFETSLELCDLGLKADSNNAMLNQLKAQLMETWVKNFLTTDYYWNAPQIQKSSHGIIRRRIRATAIYNERAQIRHSNLKVCTWKGLAETLLETRKEINRVRKRYEQEIPPPTVPVIIDITDDNIYNEARDSDDIPTKRKRKDTASTILDNSDEKTSATVRTSKRVRHKLEKNDFKKQRDLAASEFSQSIEADFRPYDADDPKTASTVRLSMFVRHNNPPPVDDYFSDDNTNRQILETFVNELNAKKLCISAHIREFIIKILTMTSSSSSNEQKQLQTPPLWFCRWPDELKERLCDLIRLEGEHIIEYLYESCRYPDLDSAAAYQTQLDSIEFQERSRFMQKAMEALLGMLEVLWDSKMLKLGFQGFDDDEQQDGIFPMVKKSIFDKCISTIESFKVSLSEIIGSSSVLSDSQEWKKWITRYYVRYYWVRAHIELCRGQLSTAMNYFKFCRVNYEKYAESHHDTNASIVMANFYYDAYMDKNTINNKIKWVEIEDSLPKDNWSRSVRYFTECVSLLVNSVSMNIHDDQVVQFWTILNTINEQVNVISDTIKNIDTIATLHEDDQIKFKSSMRLLYNLLLEILFPQDEHFLNTTSDTTIGAILNLFCVRVSILLFKLVSISPLDNLREKMADFLRTMHKQLGIREMCAADNGAFLKLCLTVLPSLNPSEYQEHDFQCAYCLYGFSLGGDPDSLEEHKTEPLKLDDKMAKVIFRMINSSITERSLRTGQLKTGIKEALDEISSLIVNVQATRNWIDAYLHMDIDFDDCILHQYVDYRLFKKYDAPEIQKQLFYLRGKIFQYQYKTRAKPNQSKAIFVLQSAIEQFTFHLYYNPNNFSSWFALAHCYSKLAEENMAWNALEITKEFVKIAVYQKMSFLCFTLAAKIQNSPINQGETISRGELTNFWREFGSHVYFMTTQPMSRRSFLPVRSDEQPKLRIPSEEDLYAFSAYCFGQALKYENMNYEMNATNRDWRIPYMLGKSLQKLGKNPHIVLRLYKVALDRTPERSSNSGQEKIIDTEYKLTSTLAKYLFRNQIEPEIVRKYLEPELHKEFLTKNGANNRDIHHLHPLNNNISAERRYAFDLIFARLLEIRKNDKMKWHHRPVFRHAWLLYYVDNNPTEAKKLHSSLFQLKASTKSVMNVWRPEFERAGRHFVYVGNYIDFLIELAKDTHDVDCIKSLCGKLKKAQNILLRYKELNEAAEEVHQFMLADQQPIIYLPQPTTKTQSPSSLPTNPPIPSQSSAFTHLPVQSQSSSSSLPIPQVIIQSNTSSYQPMNPYDYSYQPPVVSQQIENSSEQSINHQSNSTTSSSKSKPTIIELD